MRSIDQFADPTAETLRRLDAWAADQREREAWNDGDRPTYHYRAETLEVAAAEIRRLDEESARLREALREVVDLKDRADGGEMWRPGYRRWRAARALLDDQENTT